MVRRDPRLQVNLLAVGAIVHHAILAILGRLDILASLTDDIVGIHGLLLDGCGHHPSSEVVGGEIFNSLQRNLERTIALWTLDFPAARAYSRF